MSLGICSYLWRRSSALFSPKCRNPASYSGVMLGMGCVLLTTTNWTCLGRSACTFIACSAASEGIFFVSLVVTGALI